MVHNNVEDLEILARMLLLRLLDHGGTPFLLTAKHTAIQNYKGPEESTVCSLSHGTEKGGNNGDKKKVFL
jgi:hypothetical protein